MEHIYKRVLKLRLLAYVVLLVEGNQRTRGKPPNLDGRELPYHMPLPRLEPWPCDDK